MDLGINYYCKSTINATKTLMLNLNNHLLASTRNTWRCCYTKVTSITYFYLLSNNFKLLNKVATIQYLNMFINFQFYTSIQHLNLFINFQFYTSNVGIVFKLTSLITLDDCNFIWNNCKEVFIMFYKRLDGTYLWGNIYSIFRFFLLIIDFDEILVTNLYI